MRQAFFAVVLVVAAFAGGATVNGPGVRWAQNQILGYMGIKDGGEIASIDAPKPPDDGPGPQRAAAEPGASGPNRSPAGEPVPSPVPAGDPKKADPESSPAARIASGLGSLLGGLGKPAKKEGAAGQAQPDKAPSRGTEPGGAPKPLPIPTSVPEPASSLPAGPRPDSAATGPGREKTEADRPPGAVDARASAGSTRERPSSPPPADPGTSPAPLDPEIGAALLASRSPISAHRASLSKESDSPDSLPLEAAPSSGGSPDPPAPDQAAGESSSSAASPGGSLQDWTSVRRRLHALGVSRYTIEGQPNGRVSFACLIPLAGRQAVCQRFEAEGADEMQAAKAAIRRIGLWRATRPSSAGTP